MAIVRPSRFVVVYPPRDCIVPKLLCASPVFSGHLFGPRFFLNTSLKHTGVHYTVGQMISTPTEGLLEHEAMEQKDTSL